MKLHFLALSAICVAPILVNAQTPAADADRAVSSVQALGRQNLTSLNQSILETGIEQAPELFPGELEDVGPQYLVIDAAPPHRWVQLYTDVQFFYTSNALLTEKGNSDTGVLINILEASIHLPPFALGNGEAAVRAGYRHQMWFYSLDNTSNQLNNIDFDVSTIFTGFRHQINENWAAGFGLDYNRYLSHDDGYTEFYTELVPNWSIQRTFRLSEASYLIAAYAGAYHWTQTDPAPVKHINDRLSNILALSYSRELMSRLYIQASYRFQWSHYTENSNRNDIYNSFGIGLIYAFSDWGAIKASVNYENRNSTDDFVNDYSKWDTGGGLAFAFQF